MLLGEVISDTNEKTSWGVAQKICSDYIEETRAVLRKVRPLVLLGLSSNPSQQQVFGHLCF